MWPVVRNVDKLPVNRLIKKLLDLEKHHRIPIRCLSTQESPQVGADVKKFDVEGISKKCELNVTTTELTNHNPDNKEIKLDQNVHSHFERLAETYKVVENDDDCDDSEDLVGYKALNICNKDLSFVAPILSPTFNFAAYANKSEMIQQLIKLNVNLYEIEESKYGMKAMEAILKRNFEDIKDHIQFLHDSGVDADKIGYFITKNPLIIEEDIDDLKTRIRYLRAHNFSRSDVAHIISMNPRWLSHPTKHIDTILGYFQREFKLSGQNVRLIINRVPKIVNKGLGKFQLNTFCVKEEMGFDDDQRKKVLLNEPRIWLAKRERIAASFDYIHNTMGIPHEILCKKPKIILCRMERLKNRHRYLKMIKKAQFDPKQPLYVSPDQIVDGDDYSFCLNVAKTSIELYNMFLKTL